MDEKNDRELLRDFTETSSEAAFATLVRRHSPLVFSAARRLLADPTQAEDVTQAVFIILARKAKSLKSEVTLTGWLYRTACYAANDALKLRRRRQKSETEASMLSEEECDNWNSIAPQLDATMSELKEQDRQALLLRYFQNRSLREVGIKLGLNEDSAQKRVGRALERLRNLLMRRGFTVSELLLDTLISQQAVAVVPKTLTTTLTLAALKGAATTSSTGLIVKSTLKLIALKKLKTIALTASLVLSMGSGITFWSLRSKASPNGASIPNPATNTPLALLSHVAAAAARHDGDQVAKAILVTTLDRQRRLDVLRRLIDAVGAFDRADRERFGAVATEAALWQTTPVILYRLDFGQRRLSEAKEVLHGNTATVMISRDDGTSIEIPFQKSGPDWKVVEEVVDTLVDARDAKRFALVSALLERITSEVTNGRYSSAAAAMAAFRPRALEIYGAP